MEANDIAIAPAGFEHAEAIFNLVKAYPDLLLPRPIGDITQNIDRFLVALRGREVVGSVSWAILPDIGTPHDPYVEIKSLAVSLDMQGRGIGRRLVREAINRIRSLHPVRVLALTFTPPFFEGLGFRRIAKEGLMHKIYAGCINCTRYDSPFTCPEVAMALDLRDEPAG